MIINNPVVRGFYPDPSVCKANGKYYLVCSSMQYFPGVPLFESDDLINWKQIGHCLTRDTQVNLHDINSSGGVFAPTIRYNDGRFYMVTTNDTYHKNFFVYTDDIYSEWSEPVFVDQGGIDPSLYFEDGKTYFISNGTDESDGRGCIFQCEINPVTGEQLTPSKPLWKGNGGRYLESPHMYKFGRYYYIMAAEGGTEYGHMITYARSENIYGPFVNYEKNPVLTNRDFGGHENILQGIGHGDLIQDDFGNTFIMCLGFRMMHQWMPYHQLGREVCIVPVKWDDNGWFTAGENGRVPISMDMDIHSDKAEVENHYSISMPFDSADRLRLTYLRDPDLNNYKVEDDSISLKPSQVSLNEAKSPTFIGVRQSEFDTELTVDVKCKKGEAGITFYMDEKEHYDIAWIKVTDNDGNVIRNDVITRLVIGDAVAVLSRIPAGDNVKLKVVTEHINYNFYAIIDGKETFMGKADAKYLTSEVASGFTGVFMGMYATSNVIESNTCITQINDISDSEWAEFSSLTWKQDI